MSVEQIRLETEFGSQMAWAAVRVPLHEAPSPL